MVADVVHSQQQILLRPGRGQVQLRQKGEGLAPFLWLQLLDDLARGVVQSTKDRPPLIRAGRRYP